MPLALWPAGMAYPQEAGDIWFEPCPVLLRRLSLNPPRHCPRAVVKQRRIGSPPWLACGEAARVGLVAVVG
jgi:hypothetical protein